MASFDYREEVGLATFDLIVVAAAFDRWRMRGLTSGARGGAGFDVPR
jgi:hypothetical protein